MHGGAHAHSHDDEPLFVRPSLKPLVLSWGLFWMNMRRHSLGRSELKKASYADGEASRITWVGAAVNLFLSISKLVAGIVGNSAAMLSDAGHSLSDLVSDALTLVTLRMSALPPDIDHPYGHGRFESVGSLGIATLLHQFHESCAAEYVALLSQHVRAVLHGSIGRDARGAELPPEATLELRFLAAVGRHLGVPLSDLVSQSVLRGS